MEEHENKEQTIVLVGDWSDMTFIDNATLMKLAKGRYEYTELNIELDTSLAKRIE